MALCEIFELFPVTPNRLNRNVNRTFLIGDYDATRILQLENTPEQALQDWVQALRFAAAFPTVPNCFTDLITLVGHESTQTLQVLPTHFSRLKITLPSLSTEIASTGHSDTQVPQLKHSSASTSTNLGIETSTPLSRKAFTVLSNASSEISAKISPPFEFTCAVIIFIGTLSSRIICEVIGCSTRSSAKRKRIRTISSFTFPTASRHLPKSLSQALFQHYQSRATRCCYASPSA